ncbi:MAG: hypothetical protein RIS43_262 [Actinomycetota bacterium]
MGILERFEQRVERLIGTNLSHAESGEVQPVDLASALIQELDDCATIAGVGQTIVHNLFSIDLSDSDYNRLSEIESPLRTELMNVVKEHNSAHKYTTLGGISIRFSQDNTLPTGVFRIVGDTTDHSGDKVSDVSTAAVRQGLHMIINGLSHPLTLQRTTFGRGTDVDIRVDDNGVSRRHCEIVLSNPPVLRDLNSTNGTFILGERVTEQPLLADVDIKIGNTVMQFRMR